ncbi:MAG TPA: 6,7-dimethyl-8-ribityllumazine synthase [Patescibacteria group bacterium]|nr:6,7-dimethyl-8-ribityllumazine synthase [Patescibacteria group bacterium]
MQQPKTIVAKPFDASHWKLGVVVADFNAHITSQLLDSALARAKDYNISKSNIDVMHVAGAIEIPLILQTMAKTRKYNVLLAVGCVIKGETTHFDYVCSFVTDGVLKVQLSQNMPIGFGVLTCNDEAQAIARAHLGGEHLDAVLHQALSIQQIN